MNNRHAWTLSLLAMLLTPANGAASQGSLNAQQRHAVVQLKRMWELERTLKTPTLSPKKRKRLAGEHKKIGQALEKNLKFIGRQLKKKTDRPRDFIALITHVLTRHAPEMLVTMRKRLASAKMTNTKMLLSNTFTALELFRMEHSRLPTAKEGLASLFKAKMVQRIPQDAWGRHLAYRRVKGAALCTITSAGPDGKFKTSDDLRMDCRGRWLKAK